MSSYSGTVLWKEHYCSKYIMLVLEIYFLIKIQVLCPQVTPFYTILISNNWWTVTSFVYCKKYFSIWISNNFILKFFVFFFYTYSIRILCQLLLKCIFRFYFIYTRVLVASYFFTWDCIRTRGTFLFR